MCMHVDLWCISSTGMVTFSNGLAASNLMTSDITMTGDVNGVSLTTLNSTVLKHSGDQTITANWVVTGDVTLASAHYASTWNGKQLSSKT